MLEEIRKVVMTKMKDKRYLCNSWIGDWSPTAMGIFQAAKYNSIGCKVLWNGASGYEIGEGVNKHTVMLDKRICTCRVWELIGIPCCHAIAALNYSKKDPLSMMAVWYHKTTYQKAYEFPILPVPGATFYNTDDHEPILPPPITKLPGRPKKKRMRASNEPRQKSTGNGLTKKGQTQHCSVCNITGHNKKSCQSVEKSSTTSRQGKLPPRRKGQAGVGCYVAPDGRSTMNPGLSSEMVISLGTQSEIPHESDPIIRGPIPNEREINSSKMKLRSISFSGEGSGVRQPTSLPFKPPGL